MAKTDVRNLRGRLQQKGLLDGVGSEWWNEGGIPLPPNPGGRAGGEIPPEVLARVAAFRQANEARAPQNQQLAQQFGVDSGRIGEIGQAYNSARNSGGYQGTFEQFVQENFGDFNRGWYGAPPPNTSGGIPGGLQPGGLALNPPPPPMGQQPPPGGAPGGLPIPNRPPPQLGGPEQVPRGGLPNSGPAMDPNVLASFGYQRGPNGEIMPLMLRQGQNPFQIPGQPGRAGPAGLLGGYPLGPGRG